MPQQPGDAVPAGRGVHGPEQAVDRVIDTEPARGPKFASLLLGLREGVSAAFVSEDELILDGTGVRFDLGRLGAGLRAALRRLFATGEEEGRLTELVYDADGTEGLARLYYVLRRLVERGLLTWTVQAADLPMAVLAPTSPYFNYPGRQVAAERSYVLSRFAYIHRQDTHVVVDSPLAHGRVVLHDGRVASMLHALAVPRRVAEVAARCPDLAANEITLLLTLLINASVLVQLDERGESCEDAGSALQMWEFHDLLFHARSRNGRHDQPVGGTFRFLGDVPAPPALRPLLAEQTVELCRPDLERLASEDVPFAQVQEMRASVRSYGAHPITERQLGEFLYRVARVREHRTADVPTPQGQMALEVASRPYPGGGTLHELEIYAAVNACEGLAPGLYHYDPLGHRLGLCSEQTADVEGLLRYAGLSIALPTEEMQVLLVLAARFPRVAWKYESIAYSLILKDVGVVFQTMYLVATAMGLAPCALGGGNADLFARAAGVDYYEESSVGEFLLGSRA
jgi:SagB-type dehydrogenase family enzyme